MDLIEVPPGLYETTLEEKKTEDVDAEIYERVAQLNQGRLDFIDY